MPRRISQLRAASHHPQRGSIRLAAGDRAKASHHQAVPGRAAAPCLFDRIPALQRKATTLHPARSGVLATHERAGSRPPRPDMPPSHRLSVTRLLAPHWKSLAAAFAAMLAGSAAVLLEPWPLKIVFDHVLGSKPPPFWLSALGTSGGVDVLGAAAV